MKGKRKTRKEKRTLVLSPPDSQAQKVCIIQLNRIKFLYSLTHMEYTKRSFSFRLLFDIESRYSTRSRHTFELLPTAFGICFLPYSMSLSLTGRRLLIE